jgi:hypothetical protein
MATDQYGRLLCSMCYRPMIAQPHLDHFTSSGVFLAVFECQDCAKVETVKVARKVERIPRWFSPRAA